MSESCKGSGGLDQESEWRDVFGGLVWSCRFKVFVFKV